MACIISLGSVRLRYFSGRPSNSYRTEIGGKEQHSEGSIVARTSKQASDQEMMLIGVWNKEEYRVWKLDLVRLFLKVLLRLLIVARKHF